MKKIIIWSLSLFTLFVARPALAVCPVCTVAVGVGVGLSRWLGIDDVITGLWIGGLTLSVSFWTVNWLIKKNYNFSFRTPLVVLGYYALVVVPLFYGDIVGHPFNTIWGTDRLIFGIAVGSGLFFAGERLYVWLKAKNGGHAHFPFEKVVMPVAPLVIASLAFFFFNK